MQKFNKNSSNNSNKRQNIFYNDKQTNKRAAEVSRIAPVPVKKYITTTSNSNCMLQLKCNGNGNVQSKKYIKNNIKRSNMFISDITPRIYPSNTRENFAGSIYLKYNNNLNENMYFNGLSLLNNKESDDNINTFGSTGHKQVYVQQYASNNVTVHEDNDAGSIGKPFVVSNALKERNNNTQSMTPKTVQRKQKINQDTKHCYNNHNPKNVTNKNENQISLYSNQLFNTNSSKLLNTNSEFSNIWHPNVPPSANMQSRMMQALEGILTISTDVICNQYNVDNTDAKLFIRPMKTMISDRIKKVLMGRTVGSRSDIMDCYLRKYPKDTDTELLALFKDRNNINSRMTYLIEADDPHQYYTINMMRLINTKMKKIISVVEEMYENSEKQSNDYLNNGSLLGFSASGHDGTTDPNYTALKSIFYDQSMSYAIESEFPTLLRKFKNEIVHMILGKETGQAITMNLLPRRRRGWRDDM